MGQQLSLDLRISYNNLMYKTLKGGFFQKVRCVFQISKMNIPNHYPELEI